MPLQKFTAELLLTKGIEQKVPEQVIPDESLTTALNVDFSKVGAARKREGFVPNSNLVLNAGVMDEMRRLGSRQHREALCITETVTQIGSTAGVGKAGDTLYSYSEQAERWIVRGKMPRPNVDVLWKSGQLASDVMVGNDPAFNFVTGGIQNYVFIAYRVKSQTSSFSLRVVVLDVGGDVGAPTREAATVVVDTTFSSVGDPIGWVTAEDKIWLIVSDAARSDAYELAFPEMLMDTTPRSISASAPTRAVSGDGTRIYLVLDEPGNGIRVQRRSKNMALVIDYIDNTVPMARQEVGIDARLGHVDIVRHDTTAGTVYITRFDKGLTQLLPMTYVTTGTASGTLGSQRGNVQICTLGETDAMIMWANQRSTVTTTDPCYLSVGLMRMTTGALVGYFNHQSLVPYAQPFLIDGRCFFVAMRSTGYVRHNASFTDLMGSTVGEESFMCFQLPVDGLDPYSVPLAVAQWRYGQANAKFVPSSGSAFGTYWAHGRTIYQSGNGIYVTTNVLADAGQSRARTLPLPELVRLEFGDAVHRWRHEDFHDCGFFAGGILTSYDGDRAYEAATGLHAPAICGWGATAGGTLTAGVTYTLQVAILYTDANGRECWGPPSRQFQVATSVGNQSVYLLFSPPTVSMRPDLGNQFIGRARAFIFIASPTDTELVSGAEPQDIDPTSLGVFGMTVSAPPPSDSVKMYTAGYELDNWPPPPCRSVASHNGRLFVIGDDDNQVWYSKPTRADRCVEFALQQVIPLAERGTALASLGDRLCIFTTRAIYAVQGDGPDPTGNPPDGFSRPLLISPDYGCVEYCAVGRTPLGVIFRGQQGFYLLTQGFSVEYIGGSVEDITSGWESTRAIIHDQERSCCRIIGYTGTESQELCFWYDTKRWSLNTLATGESYSVVDAMMMGKNLLEATTDKSVAVVSRYRLGTRDTEPGHQDYGNDYDQVVQTGWVTFNHVATLKRFYRALVFLRPLGADARVQVQVFVNWDETPSTEREFQISSTETEVRCLRVHLKQQKIKAAKIRVTVTSEGAGVEMLKLGFEMGMKQMAVKEKQGWSQ